MKDDSMIWLIGAGEMSLEYAKVLSGLQQTFKVIGRGASSALSFERHSDIKVIQGGLETFLKSNPKSPTAAIVSVSVEHLFQTTMALLNYGIKSILVEKPAALELQQIEAINCSAKASKISLFVAYNRRFYSSTLALISKIEAEGGVTSFNFELTEWSHIIETLDKPMEVLSKWFLVNSSHVADLAFFLGGFPAQFSSFVSGSLAWHPSASIFTGAGISTKGAPFNYAANWQSAGRWSVEVLTQENRYILSPLELLFVKKRGEIKQSIVEIDDSLDRNFKPGLYKQLQAFLGNDHRNLCSIEQHLKSFSIYQQMAGYSHDLKSN